MVASVRVKRNHRQMTFQRRSASSWKRLVVTFVALLAFVVQSFVTQTHIHVPGESYRFAALSGLQGLAADTKLKASQQRDRHGIPPKDDSANCPLCQQINVAGAFVASPATLLHLPSELGSAEASKQVVAVAVSRTSHNWQGRAPPIA